MFLCLCKGLSDSDVRAVARALAGPGMPSLASFLESLHLDDDDVCGLCAQAPWEFADLAVEEWTRLGLQYKALYGED